MPAFGQNNIKKTAAITYTLGPPTYTVLLPSSSEIAVDSSTGKIYQYHRTSSTWLQIGQGIDVIAGGIAPAYTPARNQSIFAINAVDSLYHYRSGAWRHLNATSIADGDKGDIDVTSTGAVWTVDTSAITTIKVAANAIDSTKISNGGVSVLDLGQHGASSGNVLKWNGTQWAAGTDNTGGSGSLNEADEGLTTSADTTYLGVVVDDGTGPVDNFTQNIFRQRAVIAYDGPNRNAVAMQFNAGNYSYSGGDWELIAIEDTAKLRDYFQDSDPDTTFSIVSLRGASYYLVTRDPDNSYTTSLSSSISGANPRTDITSTKSAATSTVSFRPDSITFSDRAVYNSDLSGSYTARTHIDKGYADAQYLPTTADNIAAGQVAYGTGTGITSEAGLNYDAANNRLGVGDTAPSYSVSVQTAGDTDGVNIKSDGTVDRDPGILRFSGVGAGPYTQTGSIGLDVFTNAGASPEGEAFVFKLQTASFSERIPMYLYKDNAAFSSASQFYISNTANGRLVYTVPSAYDHNFRNNTLVTGSSFTTADTTVRLRVIGRTQTSASWGFRVYDGNNQSVFQVRDDAKVGITATTLDASLTINGAGATSGTYGLMVTPSGGTTTTASLVVRDDNRVGIRTNAPQTPLNVVGTGTASGSTALLVEGSGGQDNLNVRDDGVNIGQGFAMASNAPSIVFGAAAGTGPTNDLCSGGANGFVLLFTTGTGPSAASSIFTATLPKSYPNGVVATITCGDTDCLDEIADIYISGTGNNSVTLTTRGTLTASTAYLIYCTVIGY